MGTELQWGAFNNHTRLGFNTVTRYCRAVREGGGARQNCVASKAFTLHPQGHEGVQIPHDGASAFAHNMYWIHRRAGWNNVRGGMCLDSPPRWGAARVRPCAPHMAEAPRRRARSGCGGSTGGTEGRVNAGHCVGAGAGICLFRVKPPDPGSMWGCPDARVVSVHPVVDPRAFSCSTGGRGASHVCPVSVAVCDHRADRQPRHAPPVRGVGLRRRGCSSACSASGPGVHGDSHVLAVA